MVIESNPYLHSDVSNSILIYQGHNTQNGPFLILVYGQQDPYEKLNRSPPKCMTVCIESCGTGDMSSSRPIGGHFSWFILKNALWLFVRYFAISIRIHSQIRMLPKAGDHQTDWNRWIITIAILAKFSSLFSLPTHCCYYLAPQDILALLPLCN